MSRNNKTLAKSLHTVSVIVNVARNERAHASVTHGRPSPAEAIRKALHILGYGDATDPYDLAAVALKQLEKEQANGNV